MKRSFKYLILAIIILAFALPASADNVMRMRTWKIFDAQVIAPSGNAVNTLPETIGLDLQNLGIFGFCSFQVELTGDGTATFDYEYSSDGVKWFSDEIDAGFTDVSGDDADGHDFFATWIWLSRYVRMRVTETSTTDSITVTVYMTVQ